MFLEDASTNDLWGDNKSLYMLSAIVPLCESADNIQNAALTQSRRSHPERAVNR
jgi:hypothetical protein